MITDWIFNIIYIMWRNLVESLPTMPTYDSLNYIKDFLDFMMIVNYYLPVYETIEFARVIAGLYALFIVFKIKRWRLF